jgi:hypothetical protein
MAVTICLSSNIYALYLPFVSHHHHRRRQLREVKDIQTARFLRLSVWRALHLLFFDLCYHCHIVI